MSMRFRRKVLVSALFSLLWTAMAYGQESSYKDEIERWREQREEQLKSDNGWLTVAGLFWLKSIGVDNPALTLPLMISTRLEVPPLVMVKSSKPFRIGSESFFRVPVTLMTIVMESIRVASFRSSFRVTDISAQTRQGAGKKIASRRNSITGFFILPVLA